MKCFGWIALAAGTAWAVPDPSPQERDLELLRSGEIRTRESAGVRLASLPLSSVPALRRLAAAEDDVEVRERLCDAVRRICLREARQRMLEGRVEDALRALATADVEAEGIPDLIRRYKAEIEEELRGSFPAPPCRDECCEDLTQLADEVREDYGPWGTAVLLDCLERQDAQIPAFALLRERDDIVPCVVRAVVQGPPARRNEACTLLHAMVLLDGKSVHSDEALTRTLRALAGDRKIDPGVRDRSRELLDRLASAANGCGP